MNAPDRINTNSLAKAFVAAQKGFSPALKTSTNPHFKSRYADLSACVEAVIDALNANGIALVQHTHEDATGVTVETVFLHESGESMSCGKLHVPASKQDPQGYGSALTYARRYSLMAACGIAPEDDDGNAASKGKKETKVVTPSGAITQTDPAVSSLMANDEQLKFLQDVAATLVQMVEVEGKTHDAYEHLEAQKLDSDEKLALWDILAPNSKTRAALKKEGQSRRL